MAPGGVFEMEGRRVHTANVRFFRRFSLRRLAFFAAIAVLCPDETPQQHPSRRRWRHGRRVLRVPESGTGPAAAPEHRLHPRRRPRLGRPRLLWAAAIPDAEHRLPGRQRHPLHAVLQRHDRQCPVALLPHHGHPQRPYAHPRQPRARPRGPVPAAAGLRLHLPGPQGRGLHHRRLRQMGPRLHRLDGRPPGAGR